MEHVPGRSINLAMSVRAITALTEVGVADTVLSKVIPMHARMIHELDGRTWAYPYGTHGEVLYSFPMPLKYMRSVSCYHGFYFRPSTQWTDGC